MVLVVSRIYCCRKGHEIVAHDPHILKMFAVKNVVPFAFSHRSGMTSEHLLKFTIFGKNACTWSIWMPKDVSYKIWTFIDKDILWCLKHAFPNIKSRQNAQVKTFLQSSSFITLKIMNKCWSNACRHWQQRMAAFPAITPSKSPTILVMKCPKIKSGLNNMELSSAFWTKRVKF